MFEAPYSSDLMMNLYFIDVANTYHTHFALMSICFIDEQIYPTCTIPRRKPHSSVLITHVNFVLKIAIPSLFFVFGNLNSMFSQIISSFLL